MLDRVCRTISWGIVLAGTTLLAGPDSRAQDRTPRFPFGYSIPDTTGDNTIEWQGGDGPYGVYIQPNYSFWAFSDTYIGPMGSTTRGNTPAAIGNSIAIGQTNSSINGGNFTPFYFNSGNWLTPGGFFPNQANGYRFWPRKAIMINGQLYVFLLTQYAPSSGPQQYLGSFVARISNPTAIPTSWQISYFGLIASAVNQNCPLTFGLEAQLFASDPNNLYVYGLYTPAGGGATSVVIALDLNTLATTANNGYFPQQYAQYLANAPTGGGTFEPGYGVPAPGQPANYFNTEINPYYYSLRYNATAQKYQLVGCLGLSAGPAQDPSGGSNHNTNQWPYVWMNPNPFGPFNNSATTAAQLPAFAEFNPSYDTYVNQNYKYVYTAREWVDTSLTNDYQIAMTYTYSSAYFPDTINRAGASKSWQIPGGLAAYSPHLAPHGCASS